MLSVKIHKKFSTFLLLCNTLFSLISPYNRPFLTTEIKQTQRYHYCLTDLSLFPQTQIEEHVGYATVTQGTLNFTVAFIISSWAPVYKVNQCSSTPEQRRRILLIKFSFHFYSCKLSIAQEVLPNQAAKSQGLVSISCLG